MTPAFKFRHLNRIVGAFVLAAAGVLLGGIVLVGKARHWLEPQFGVEVLFAGQEIGLLRPGLPVKILGETAGEVVEAHLKSATETSASLTIRERYRSRLRSDCYAVIHTPVAGLIGDTFVEVWPGQSTQALPPDTPMHSQRGEDLVELARHSVQSFGEAAGQIRDLIAENRKELQLAIVNVRRMSDNLDRMVADNRELVNQALSRLEAMGRQVSEMIAENRGSIKEAAERLPRTVEQLGEAGAQASRLIAENRDDLRLVAGRLASATPKIDDIAEDLRTLTHHAAQGQGSVGKFVMTDDAHDKLVAAVDSLNARLDEVKPLTGGLSELALYGGVDGGWNARSGSFTAGAYLRMEPHPWKFYQGGVSYRSAPSERRHTKSESPDSIPIDFNLMLGWRFGETATKRTYYLTVAGGIIETRLGGYVEMPLWRDWFAVRVLARGKQNNRDLDDRRYEDGSVLLRATATARIWRTTYLTAGVDDCIDAPGLWLGARLEFLDNDLRNLTSVGGLLK